MNINKWAMTLTGLSAAKLFGGAKPLVEFACENGVTRIASWAVPGVVQPSAADIAAAITAPDPAPSVAQLGAVLVAAGSAACNALTLQIVPDQTHQNAYVNAAAIVGPGATVPTADPAKTAFANLAAQNGAQPQAFATLVVAIAAASFQLSATLGALEAAAASAKTPSDLSTSLQAFETSLTAIVTGIGNAGVNVVPPAAITIVGINA